MLPGVYLCVSTIGFSSILGGGDVHGRVARALDLQFAGPEVKSCSDCQLYLVYLNIVSHSILFDKPEHYGILGLALKWIRSYFSNRLHFVEYNGYVSSRAQGSILRPLFFMLHQRCRAENHKDKDHLTNTLNAELNKLLIWFRANRLSLNLKKKLLYLNHAKNV